MPRPIAYGPAPAQTGDLWLADDEDGPLAVAVLWHGGGYVPECDRALMEGVARDLCRRGWGVWHLEDRGRGWGGGWPQPSADGAAGLDRRAALRDGGEPLDLDRVVGVGF